MKKISEALNERPEKKDDTPSQEYELAKSIATYFKEPYGRWILRVLQGKRDKSLHWVYRCFAEVKQSRKSKSGQVKELMAKLKGYKLK